MDTSATMKRPMPKSSTISKGLVDDKLLLESDSANLAAAQGNDVLTTLNFHGNYQEGKPSSTAPVKINASFFSNTSVTIYAMIEETRTTILLRAIEMAHLDFLNIFARLDSGSVPSSHRRSLSF